MTASVIRTFFPWPGIWPFPAALLGLDAERLSVCTPLHRRGWVQGISGRAWLGASLGPQAWMRLSIGLRYGCCCAVHLLLGQGLGQIWEAGLKTHRLRPTPTPPLTLTPPPSPRRWECSRTRRHTLWELPTPQGQPPFSVDLMGGGCSKDQPFVLNLDNSEGQTPLYHSLWC